MQRHEQLKEQFQSRRYLTDGGLETTLIFLEGIDLPHFAAFPLLESERGRDTLRAYFRRFAGIAEEAGCGFVFEAPTWRAHPVWGETMDYGEAGLDRVNRAAIGLMLSLRDEFGGAEAGHVVSGCIGPRGDGYVADHAMDAEQARDYHMAQIRCFAEEGADMATALTLNYAEEAQGIVMAGQEVGLPVVAAFTTETDGRLPDGTTLGEAIAAVDAATNGGPVHYMINCAHPDHFNDALEVGAPWLERIGGLRVNASRMSHAELDNAEELDAGDPEELGAQCRALQDRLPAVQVLGGCCGTDHRHIGCMSGLH